MVVYAYIDPQAVISGDRRSRRQLPVHGHRAAARLREGAPRRLSDDHARLSRPAGSRVRAATVRDVGSRRDLTDGGAPLPTAGQCGMAGTTVSCRPFSAIIKKGGRPPEVRDPLLMPARLGAGGPAHDRLLPLLDGHRRLVRDPVPLGSIEPGRAGPHHSWRCSRFCSGVSTSAGFLTFFLLGFGSFLLESLVLFNSFLLLGDPNLSAAVAVGVFLLGSLLSERLERSPWVYAMTPVGGARLRDDGAPTERADDRAAALDARADLLASSRCRRHRGGRDVPDRASPVPARARQRACSSST